LTEGRREHTDSAPSPKQPSLRVFFKTVWSSRTFRQLTYGYTVLSFVDCGRTQWTPTFFIRSFGVDITSLGIWSALIFGISSVCGMLLGGYLCAKYAARQERLQLRAMTVVYVMVAILSVLVCVSHSVVVAFAVTGLSIVLGSATTAPSFSIVQSLVPDNMRAQATALLLLLANLVGLGLGPLVAGALSDGMRAMFGTESLRYSLLIFSPGYIWCGWHSWLAGRTVPAELAAIESSASGHPGLGAIAEPFSTARSGGWSTADHPLNPPP
jgi:MFS family permease